MIEYTISKSTDIEILDHFKQCNQEFFQSLCKRVNIEKYIKKLVENSMRFEVWDKNKLIGLVAVYFNDTINYYGYVTNVSVVKQFTGKSIATELLKFTFEYAKKHNFKEIILEVATDNYSAICLYEKLNFTVSEKKEKTLIMKYIV